MKKTILSLLSMLALVVIVTSCKSDDVSSESIFKTEEQPKNEFDTWLYNNFTLPYNIEFRYRYQDSETDNYYNVVPADPEKAKALAILVKELWIGAYAKEKYLDDELDRLRNEDSELSLREEKISVLEGQQAAEAAYLSQLHDHVMSNEEHDELVALRAKCQIYERLIFDNN